VLAGTPALHAEVAGALKARFKELTGLVLPAADLTKALREPMAPTVKARRPLTEFGNAQRMLDKYGQGLMHVTELNGWYCWTGVYWRRASDVEIEHYAKETVMALVNEINDQEDPAAFFKHCAVSQQAKMIKNMVFIARSDPRVSVPASELDKHSHYLGVANGVVDLRTGELLPPDPELRITKVTGCDYVMGAKAPLFEQTVSEVFNGDAEAVAFFQRLIGHTAMGNPTQDIMVIPYGNGSNGKSTVLGAVRKVFGSHACAAEASTFMSDAKGGGNAGGARPDILRLQGTRFVYVNEPDENSELREGSVKAMTGGDTITARGLYAGGYAEITPTWVVFMPTNHKPIVKGSDNGIWRRLMLIPFTRNFDNDPTIVKDPDRESKLEREMEGVLNWIVQGALAFQKRGLDQTGKVKAAREEYRQDMDLLAEWIEECCEVGPYHSEEANRLWLSWEQFAKSRGLITYVKNSVSLGRRLETRFPLHRGTGGKRTRKGLRVRDDFESLV
jgi:putative DNA primase/helicase